MSNIGILLKPFLIYILMLLMFFSCLNIKFKQIIEKIKNYREETKALAIIHLISPIIVFLFQPLFSTEIYVGLIIVTVISSGMSVVFLSELYGGISSTSLVITSMSNIISPVIVPALILFFTGTEINLDYLAITLTLIKLVIIPIFFAQIIRKTSIYYTLNKNKTNISIIILFVLIIGVIAPVREIILNNIALTFKLGLFVAILSVINFTLGYFIGKNKKENLSFAISTSYKNFTLATVVALTHFEPIVALPAVVYTVVNNLLLIPLQFWLNLRKS